jgi:hypothetical protein
MTRKNINSFVVPLQEFFSATTPRHPCDMY